MLPKTLSKLKLKEKSNLAIKTLQEEIVIQKEAINKCVKDNKLTNDEIMKKKK